jgi:hypothetical protein
MEQAERQKLINLIFEMVMVSTNNSVFCNRPRGEKMAWVANTLREVGYDTHPIGMSYGVLVDKEFRKTNEILTNNLDDI